MRHRRLIRRVPSQPPLGRREQARHRPLAQPAARARAAPRGAGGAIIATAGSRADPASAACATGVSFAGFRLNHHLGVENRLATGVLLSGPLGRAPRALVLEMTSNSAIGRRLRLAILD